MLTELRKTQIGKLKLIAYAEGISALLLYFITMPLKYGADMGEPNKVVGLLHGILFVLFMFQLLQVKIAHSWSLKKVFISIFAAILPFGPFIADKYLFKETRT